MNSLRKSILLLTTLLLGVFVSSCGDNITETDVYKYPTILQNGYGTKATCDSSSRGLVTFVDDTLFFCDGEIWSTFNGEDGVDGKFCNSVSNADGFDIYCGDMLAGAVKNGIDGLDGKPGDKGGQGSFNCEVLETSGGYDVICDGVKIGSIANGKKGPDGDSGISGFYCIAEPTTQGYDILCGGEKIGEVSNGKLGVKGIRGDSAVGCTFTSGDDGMFVLQCGEETSTIYSAVCGTMSYNPSGEKFCSGVKLYDKCKGKVYDVETQFCSFDDELYDKCGTLAYDPSTDDCCGTTVYTTAMQFCNSNKVYNKCGNSTYDPSTKGCCGTALYTSSTQFCSSNKIYNKCGTSTYDPGTKACCGTTVYTSSTQFCSSSKVYNKCGSSTYDPNSQFCDTRDNQIYKYVKVGSQTWMAQNLNYAVSGSSCAKSSCATYGRLYSTAQAKTACMSGWHLPSDSEWNTLFSGKTKAQLKSKNGWNKAGTDDYKMAILPVVNVCKYGYTVYQEKTAIFWTSNKHNDNVNRVARICDAKAVMEACSYSDTGASNSAELRNGFSVRCIKN